MGCFVRLIDSCVKRVNVSGSILKYYKYYVVLEVQSCNVTVDGAEAELRRNVYHVKYRTR